MSKENADAFRRAVEAYNDRDLDGFLDAFDPAVEWQPLTQVMLGGESRMYRGHDGVRRFVREVDEALADARIEALDIRDLGERIVVIGRLSARGRKSGAAIETPIGWVIEFKDGRVMRMRDYRHPREALEAAGLLE